MFRKQFTDVPDTRVLAHAIFDTVREPLLVLDQHLRVVAASRSFYLTFGVSADKTEGVLLYELGNGEWDIPKLRLLLSLTMGWGNRTASLSNRNQDLAPAS